jgi:tetratricopeptide (TPR) repeat protein
VRNRAALLASVIAVHACGGRQLVERRVDDQTTVGRVVPSEAYAWYARGQYHERNQELESAEYAYDQATQVDRESGSAWGALLRVRCLRNQPDTWQTLDRGRAEAEEQVPVLVAASHCAVRQGKGSSAITFARSALTLAPSDEGASLALEASFRAIGDEASADSVVRAFELFQGRPLKMGSEVAEEHKMLSPKEAREAADLALIAGDLNQARNISVGVLDPGELALRAMLLGKKDLAIRQAEWITAVDPANGEAVFVLWIGSIGGGFESSGGSGPSGEGKSTSDSERAAGSARASAMMPPEASPLLLCSFAAFAPLVASEEGTRILRSRIPCDENPDDRLQSGLSRELRR